MGLSQMNSNDLLKAYGQYLMSRQGSYGMGQGASGEAPTDGLGGLGNGPGGMQNDGGGAFQMPWAQGGTMGGSSTYQGPGNGPLETYAHWLSSRMPDSNAGQQGVNALLNSNPYTGMASQAVGKLGRMYDPAKEGTTMDIRVPGMVTNGGWGTTMTGDSADMWNLLNPGQGLGQGGDTFGGLFGTIDSGGGFSNSGNGAIYGGSASPWDWGDNYSY